MITELDEAIKHCKEKAEELKNEAQNSKKNEEVRFAIRSKFSESLHNSSGADFDVGNIDLTEYNDCLECAKDHEQLAEWLTELQERREADRWNIIRTEADLPKERDWYLGLFKEPATDFIGLPYICDYVGKVTKGTTNEGWILRHCTDVDNASDYFRNLICVAWRTLSKPYESEAEK